MALRCERVTREGEQGRSGVRSRGKQQHQQKQQAHPDQLEISAVLEFGEEEEEVRLG